MLGWKKIALMCGLSAAAGMLGAACSMEGVDTEEAADVEATMDTPGDVADDTPVDAVDESLSGRGPSWGGGGFDRRRCADRCRSDYVGCGRGRGFSSNPVERERRCRNRLDGCLLNCRRF